MNPTANKMLRWALPDTTTEVEPWTVVANLSEFGLWSNFWQSIGFWHKINVNDRPLQILSNSCNWLDNISDFSKNLGCLSFATLWKQRLKFRITIICCSACILAVLVVHMCLGGYNFECHLTKLKIRTVW